MANVDADRGKLRSLLLTSVKNYMTDEWRKDQRIKRGGGNTSLSLNASDVEDRLPPPNPGHDLSPDKIYERQWALTLLDQVLKQLRKRYESEGKSQLFETLKPFLTPDAPKTTHADAAATLNMTQSATKVATHRLRERYANILRNNIADTLGPGEDADAELQHLFSVFA
jgi:DNA-directed RNA polymerase specialized sigma24 family protein